MNVRPLIVRELRAEARRGNTYWLRSLAAGLLTAVFVWSTWNFQGGVELGPMLFSALAGGLLLAVLIVVSGITADSISREKREGTLGLLFLTPLRAKDIVVGKSLLHGLRATTLFMAVVPIVGLPFLLGGIPAANVGTFACLVPAAVLIAVASGMIASVRSREWVESIVWAEIFCAAFWFAFAMGQWLLISLLQNVRGLTPWWIMNSWMIFAPAAILYSILVLGFALRYASTRLEETWQRETTQTESWWVKIFSRSDFWRTVFHWNTRKARERNPIAWLQEYNWASRLTKWGWCALIFAAEWQLFFSWRGFRDHQLFLYRVMALGIAFSAAASFRRERQTGALELLLVTPISAGKLIWGRLQGVWIHFFPAMAILACMWTMGQQFLSLPLWYSWYLAGAYFCIPVIGFYCSLLTSNVLVGWVMTLFFGMYLPYAITEGFRYDLGRTNVPMAFAMIQSGFAIIAAYLLSENLVRRRFVTSRH